MKSVVLLLLSLGMASVSNAQWSKQDSLKIRRMLDGKEELRINKKVINEIELGGPDNAPKASTQKKWMQPDETLPTVPYEAVSEETDTLRPKAAMGEQPASLGSMGIELPRIVGIPLGSGVQLNEIGITRVTGLEKLQVPNSARSLQVKLRFSGFDFMYIFTKKCWKRKEQRRVQRTKEVLRNY